MLKILRNSPRYPRLQYTVLVWHAALLAMVLGCSNQEPQPTSDAAASPRPQVALNVAVIDDPELARGLRMLRGEWAERTGGSFRVDEITLDELAASESLEADLAVFPSRLLGELVERGWLRAMRQSVLNHPDMAMSDLLPLVREREIVYGGQVYAAPLGCQTPLLCVNPGLLQGRSPNKPFTWTELANLAADARPDGAPPPLPRDHASEAADRRETGVRKATGMRLTYLVLARAAAFTEPNLRTAFCFAAEDMSPRLTEPPFLRALENLALSFPPQQDATSLTTTGDAARKPIHAVSAVLAGKAPIAVGWPPTAGENRPAGAASSASTPQSWEALVSWFQLPVAAERYDASSGQWRRGGIDATVTLLGPGGQLVSVSKASRNAVSAFQLCQWLAGARAMRQLAGNGGGPLPCRRSLLPDIDAWLSAKLPPGQAAEVGRAVEAAMSERAFAQFPRIPGVDQYLAALGDAAAASLRRDLSAAAALQAAAERWEEITETRGRERQLRAYRRQLGLEQVSSSGQRTATQ